MSFTRPQGFPVGFETKIILDSVKNDDRIVYLNSCACLPLYDELLKATGEENIRTTGRTHESITVEDDWASLVIGQCILDEFTDASKAVYEISRILRTGGTAILSGPVSRGNRLRFERTPKPPVEVLPFREVVAELNRCGLEVVEVHDLTKQIKTELAQSGREGSKLDFDNSMDYALIKVTKDFREPGPSLCCAS